MGKYDSSVAASDRESFAYYIVVEIENFATNTISVSITPNIANSSIENLRTMMTSSNFQIAGLETKRVVFAVSIDEITRNVDLSNLNWTVELKNLEKPELKVETIHKNTELADIPLTTQTIDISTEAVTLAGGSGLIAFSIEDIPSGYNNLHLSLTDTNNTVFSECIGVYVETEEQLPTNLEEAGALLDGMSDFSKVVIATNISNIYLPSEDVYFFLMLSGFDENLTETTITAEKTLVALATSLTTGADLTIEDCFVDTMMEMPMVLVNCTIENVSANSLTIEVPSAMMMLGAVLPEGTSFPINVAQAYPMLMMSSEESIFQGETSITVPLSSKYADNSISFLFIVVGEFTEESTDISLSASYGEGQTASSSEYTYELQTINDKQGYVITGYNGEDTNIVVPTYFVDKTTNIAYDVIGIGGFAYKNITNIVLPDTLLSISNYAFNSCQQLSNIAIPDSVTSIGDNAFSSCQQLSDIAIPDSVTRIGNGAFAHNQGLKNLKMSERVTIIGQAAFYWCSGLTDLTLPSTLKSIGSQAFAFSGLTEISIPSSVTSLNDINDLLVYSKIVHIINNTQLDFNATDLGGSSLAEVSKTGTFANDLIKGEKYITYTANNQVYLMGFTDPTIETHANDMPSNATIIFSFAFNGCKKLGSVNVADNIVTIMESGFKGCSNLTNLNLGKVKNIHWEAFSDCTELTGELVIPNTTEYIGQFVFSGCAKITSINISDNQISISSGAFNRCSGLESITIDENNPNYTSKVNGQNINCILSKNGVLIRGCKYSIIPEGVVRIDQRAVDGI